MLGNVCQWHHSKGNLILPEDMVSKIYINVGIFEINASNVEMYFNITQFFIIRNYFLLDLLILKNRQSNL